MKTQYYKGISNNRRRKQPLLTPRGKFYIGYVLALVTVVGYGVWRASN